MGGADVDPKAKAYFLKLLHESGHNHGYAANSLKSEFKIHIKNSQHIHGKMKFEVASERCL